MQVGADAASKKLLGSGNLVPYDIPTGNAYNQHLFLMHFSDKQYKVTQATYGAPTSFTVASGEEYIYIVRTSYGGYTISDMTWTQSDFSITKGSVTLIGVYTLVDSDGTHAQTLRSNVTVIKVSGADGGIFTFPKNGSGITASAIELY